MVTGHRLRRPPHTQGHGRTHATPHPGPGRRHRLASHAVMSWVLGTHKRGCGWPLHVNQCMYVPWQPQQRHLQLQRRMGTAEAVGLAPREHQGGRDHGEPVTRIIRLMSREGGNKPTTNRPTSCPLARSRHRRPRCTGLLAPRDHFFSRRQGQRTRPQLSASCCSEQTVHQRGGDCARRLTSWRPPAPWHHPAPPWCVWPAGCAPGGHRPLVAAHNN